MDIKIKDYTLRSDKFSMWIEKDGNRIAGYCTSMEKLLDDFIDKKLKDNDATSMEEVIKTLDKASKDARQIAKAAIDGKFRIIRNKEK